MPGQGSLIYSFVARGTVILSEYTEFTGNFQSVAGQCLQKLPTTSNRFTYNCDGHTFNYLVEQGYSEFNVFVCFFRMICVILFENDMFMIDDRLIVSLSIFIFVILTCSFKTNYYV